MRCHIHSFTVEFDGSNKMARQWTIYLEEKTQVVKVTFIRQLGDFSKSLVKGPINFCSLYMNRPIAAPGRKASRLESSEPDAEKKRYGHQCQSHATEADHFFQGCGNKFFIFRIEIEIRDLDSQ
jgi:hypothetical protein